MADAADVARFRQDLIALTYEAPTRERPIGVAISGGPDSMALLLLSALAFPDATVAATVDHGLRPGSADEARMVAAEAARLNVPHDVLAVAEPISGSSLQARARDARYGLLAAWADRQRAMAVATAHHADDQAETFLMRAARGSGISGLAAIRPGSVIAGAAVVRPLLGWRRAALRATVRRAGLPFVDDPANTDLRHDRTRFRSLLGHNEWLDPPALGRTAAAVAEAERSLGELAALFWRERVVIAEEVVTIDPQGLPRDTLRRLARRAIANVRAAGSIAAPPFDDSANVEPLLDALRAGRRATHGGVAAAVRRGIWHFRPAPPRRSL
ncbi:tRNA lysidine(34) synthetase TilS [Sphingomonas jeddahensis]|uniref:tRNA(Ile)-lysidine synthase n=1 Tax=Sphingomonas jeddahensis TaxID=1915074 RepID=A0A1V2EVM3_9SPHN|nr:tRNA lysidine(34) synthetase TilS [Sphingomonas jeddahensis]ONF96640.1 tRNA(Ile)-lysidine synthase [Sphingomonas jeddahensis]